MIQMDPNGEYQHSFIFFLFLDKTSEHEALCVNLGYPAIIIPIPSFGLLRCIDPSTPWRRWWRKVLRGAVIVLCQYIYIYISYIYIYKSGWWLGTWTLCFHVLGMSSSQLTFTPFFRGVGIPPTSNYHHTTMAFRHVIISYYNIIEYHRHSHQWICRCHEATRDLPRAAHHGVPLWGWGQGFAMGVPQ